MTKSNSIRRNRQPHQRLTISQSTNPDGFMMRDYRSAKGTLLAQVMYTATIRRLNPESISTDTQAILEGLQ